MPDVLQPGLIESADTRFCIIQMEQSWASVLSRHDYPQPIAEQLGQVLACSVLLRSRLKQGSSIILQIQGDGAIQTLVAQSNPKNTLRGLAKWQQEFNNDASIGEIYGNAKLVMTLTNNNERYQGIVELQGESLTETLENYLSQSEQLPSRLKLFADDKHVAGLLIQRLPGSIVEEDWNRIVMLTETLTRDEMLTLSSNEIIRRLYHHEDVRIYDQQAVSFSCSCSRQRIDTVLETMGRDSMYELLDEQGMITVDCEFCNLTYHYDKPLLDQLFINHVPIEPQDIN